MRKFSCIFLVLLIMCVSASAHPGNTDINGGHYDRSTGEYHYHHGYPAHQHENGICPYETSEESEGKNKEEETEKEINPLISFFGVISAIALAIASVFCLIQLAVAIVWEIKERKKKK